MKSNRILSAVALGILSWAWAAAAPVGVTSSASEGVLPLVGNDGSKATFVVDAADAEVVTAASEAVIGDINLITGTRLSLANSLDGVKYPVIAGTIGRSSIVDGLISAGKINASDVKGKWEKFGLEIVDNPAEGIDRALVIYGSMPRGTAYGIFELSRLMGVSPYVWWADVAPEERSELYVSGDETVSTEPSVKWRGIFINDEDWGLTPWAARNIDSKYNNIGPNTYAKVMELLLRLRANVLWPAMHLCSQAFWDNKDNLPVAKRYDIALGSSHCEQMLRDNEWEWRRYEDTSGNYADGKYDQWDYTWNKAKIQRYWEERVIESKGYSAMYTLGMRGVHDWAISGYPTTEDKVRGLTEIIAFQRSLLEKHIGDPTTVPQIFIPYKEVLDAYNAGLKVPDDVILTWVDDNHGYIRQLPTKTEQQRSGGHGIYYHMSYWGTPQDYLWLCSSSPSLISYELVKGYENGIKDLWVINVGDIKPAEAELEFCMDLAWDIDKWQPENAYEYSRHWAAKTFGEDLADRLAEIKLEYYELAAAGKPEHVYFVNYNSKEMDERIERYAALVQKVENLAGSIPARLKDAYFELIEYPVKGAYYMNVKTFRAKQSLELASNGQNDQALEYAAEARKAYRLIGEITDKFNTGIAAGKWNGVMSFRPREQEQFNMPPTAGLSNMGAYTIEPEEDRFAVVKADAYTAVSGNFKTMRNLGVSGTGVTVWPLPASRYSDVKDAPYVEYKVPVKAGSNTIQARFLPTFPIHAGDPMDVAVSVNGSNPQTFSLKTVATEGKWNTTVLQGFNDATVNYVTETDGEATVRVSMLDPGIVLSDVYVIFPENEANSLTYQLLVNPDFEFDAAGHHNTTGETSRGFPMGWTGTGNLIGNSYGINNDGANYTGANLCWVNSTPMPSTFELGQTIPAEKLEPGYYLVRCKLWVEENKKGTCRLFANDNVQYYGYQSDYRNILTPGEINTYAGYAGGVNGNFTLRDMAVVVKVDEGQNLKVGIRTGNKKADGSAASDNTGWFKVDHFRIDRLDGEPANTTEDLTLTEQLITNYDFELYLDNGTVKENTSGETRRYTPYGWSINKTFPGTSYGINSDMNNPHGKNGCWFLPKDGVMPDGFELYQTIPADKIKPGKYAVYCKLWVQEGHLGTCRLFANDNVQYYGMDIDYDKNLSQGEADSFAGYIGGVDPQFLLQDMYVYVDVAEGEDLRLGIRTGNMKADGSAGDDRCGWFKTDFFRIHRLDADPDDNEDSGINGIIFDSSARGIYTLSGVKISSDPAFIENLPAGVYIVDGKKMVKK